MTPSQKGNVARPATIMASRSVNGSIVRGARPLRGSNANDELLADVGTRVGEMQGFGEAGDKHERRPILSLYVRATGKGHLSGGFSFGSKRP